MQGLKYNKIKHAEEMNLGIAKDERIKLNLWLHAMS